MTMNNGDSNGKRPDDVQVLNRIVVPDKFYDRICTGDKNIDQIFGGEDMPGMTPSTTILLTGDPGAGKSTLMLQLVDLIQRHMGLSALYNAGEQAPELVKLMADRLRIKGDFGVSRFRDVDKLVEYAERSGVDLVVADSIQSLVVMVDGEESNDEKKIAARMIDFVSRTGKVAVFVGQITKGGTFAGPMRLKHDVDVHAHISFDKDSGNRVLQLEKNRFGPAMIPHEFFMSANGMEIREFRGEAETDPGAGGGGGRTSSSERRKVMVRKAKDLLLAGVRLSGYSFEENKELADWIAQDIGEISGAYWRGILFRAGEELAREGHTIGKIHINRREHTYVEKKGTPQAAEEATPS